MRNYVALIVGFACCGVAVILPGSRSFLAGTAGEFLVQSPLNQVAAVSALLGIGGFLWQFVRSRYQRSLRATEKALQEAWRERDALKAIQSKLKGDIAALEAETPSRFYMAALLAKNSPAKRQGAIGILEKGLEGSRETIADAARLLAKLRVERDAEGDLEGADEIMCFAEALSPGGPEDLPLKAVLVEDRAARALAAGVYDPSDPRVEPILSEKPQTREEAARLTDTLCDQASKLVRSGSYFSAHRLAAKAKQVSALSGSADLEFRAAYAFAQSLMFLGRNDAALAAIDAFLDHRVKALPADSPNVFAVATLRVQALIGLDRCDEALAEIDSYQERQAAALTEDDPNIFVTAHSRAFALLRLGRDTEALEAIDSFQERQARALPPNHHDVVVVACMRAEVLANLGREEDALVEIDAFLDRATRDLGEEHPAILKAAILKGRILADLGRLEEAFAALKGVPEHLAEAFGGGAAEVTRAVALYELLKWTTGAQGGGRAEAEAAVEALEEQLGTEDSLSEGARARFERFGDR